jgi:hypothetical protein
MQRAHHLFGMAMFSLVSACDGKTDDGARVGEGGFGNGSSWSSSGTGPNLGGNGPSIGGSGGSFFFLDGGSCPPTTCASLGWACGYTVDACGNVVDCSAEGLTCGSNQVCVGGIDGPTACVAGSDPNCELCNAVPDCATADQPTRLSGRVITPGRDDANTGNQVGVPNAIVYIMKTDQIDDLPAISTGLPSGGVSCDRCEDQDLGPLLAGAITDASGNFTIEGNVPVGVDFLLVIKAGKFRRVVTHQLPTTAACQTTALPTTLPDNPARLPRTLSDGLAINLPKIAITTGRIDAMECVFEKMGVGVGEFGNFGSEARVHLYRGKGETGSPEGARIDDSTPNDVDLYGSIARMESYDMVVSDCEGGGWDGANEADLFPERIANGDKIREYVNRGGRMFASHLSMSWLHENGTVQYSAADPIATGLAAASTWDRRYQFTGPPSNLDSAGTGVVSLVGTRPRVSPRIDGFATWLVNEGVTSAPDYTFAITDPRSLAVDLGTESEEFVYRTDGNQRVQQFSFNTPYGAPDEAACGRVAYSGFHVANTAGGGAAPFATKVFPEHCLGDLTPQEKVLLYMLFDLGACVGDEPPPAPCVPLTCEPTSGGRRCGFTPDGCGNVLDCGPCRPPA